jgi:hypothetical protein
MTIQTLEFEKPIVELEEKLASLQRGFDASKIDLDPDPTGLRHML